MPIAEFFFNYVKGDLQSEEYQNETQAISFWVLKNL